MTVVSRIRADQVL